MSEPLLQSTPRQPELDGGRHDRARIGLVLLATEQTADEDMVRHAPTGVGMHFARTPMASVVTADSLANSAEGIAAAAASILPDVGPDVVCYACTSGTAVIGETGVEAELAKGAPGAKTTTLLGSVMAGLRAMDLRRIVVATPYLDEVNRIERDYMQARGFDLLDFQGLNLHSDAEMARVTPDYLKKFALEIDRPDAEAIFVSCSGLRTLEVIEDIEQAAGKPAICSNQAMLWHCLRLAGIEDRIDGLGRLLREH